MPTSNSTNFSMNGAAIMDHALTLCGIKGLGQTVDADVITLTRTTLNMLIRHLETSGVRLWGIERGILFPAWGEALHTLPVMNGNVPSCYACLESDYKQGVIDADASSGASSVTVMDNPFIAGDYFGIFTSDNGILWYTVNSVAGDTVNLYDAGTTNPASLSQDIAEGTIVVGFSTLAWMPLRIIEARRTILSPVASQNIDVPLRIIGKFDYERIPNKEMASIPIQLFHQPMISYTNIWLWPVLGQVNTIVGYSFERRYQDVDQGIDDMDFPPEAYDALASMLAARMGRLRRINMDRQRYLDEVSTVYYDQLRNYASGPASITFGASR